MEKKSNKADVYLKERKAGLLERIKGGYRFSYFRDYLSDGDAEPVSLSLPLTDKPYERSTLFPFFLGLIPEGWLLDLASRVLKIDPENTFDILLATAGDCIGAVSVSAVNEET